MGQHGFHRYAPSCRCRFVDDIFRLHHERSRRRHASTHARDTVRKAAAIFPVNIAASGVRAHARVGRRRDDVKIDFLKLEYFG
ncbi:hypothetical protein F9946_23785 [Burkholderia thailandensis]|nr:hypothetical protein [Burkholderia thailandensis]MDD1495354.1 hypothetical protein [Burkholderia thailandensis]